MPHANVWIRKRDYEAWTALENKSEFIHNALNRQHFVDGAERAISTPMYESDITLEEARTWTANVKGLDGLIKEKNVKFCKNSHPIPDGQYKCLGKGCKYA